MSSSTAAVLDARFDLEQQVGMGAMGVVYKARDRETNEPVAVKIMCVGGHAEALRFIREGATLAELHHAAIVRYVTHGTSSQGETYLAMEWLEGETLENRLHAGPLSIEETLVLARRVTDGLAVAHRRGIVHRDLKPSNLFLPDGSFDEVKILDFGIARRIWDDQRLTRTGTILGTPLYMSPEQARADDRIDERSDIYSLGAVLFECLTGEPPFMGASAMAILCKICLEEPQRLRKLVPRAPAALEALLASMMAKDPHGRPRDAFALATELAGISGVSSPALVSVPPRVSLTEVEQRVLCAIFVRGASMRAEESLDALTISINVAPEDAAEKTLSVHGGRLQHLVDGSMVVTFPGGSVPTDQAAEAARCALALRQVLVDAHVVVCTGRGTTLGRMPIGDVIDLGVALLQNARGGSIRLDATMARLLDARFELDRGGDGIYLLRERELRETSRRVLGKDVACVGREPELALLDGIFTAAMDSDAQAVLVTAPAGVGKTRLRQELVSRIEQRGGRFELLLGRADSVRAGSPFGLVAPAIRWAAGVSTEDSPTTRCQKLQARISLHLAGEKARRVAEFLGELAGIHFLEGSSAALHAARQDARLMGDQMRAAWIDWLEAECSEKPVLLVLEDLHWSDAPSVQLVDSALRVLRERPFMVLALARPEVSTRFPRLWENHGVRTFALNPLPRKVCERVILELLGHDTPRELVRRVAEQSEGNPFFLEELVRGLSLGHTELPETVIGMLQARLDALGSDAARVLRAASIFGQTFNMGAVQSLVGELESRTTDALRALVEREVIQPQQGTGPDQYVFRHALVREASYATLTDGDRVLGHRLAGEWLVGAGETDAMVLANHFDRGADRENAAVWYARASVQALQGDDLDAALARAERSRSYGATAETLSEVSLVEAHARYWQGELVAAAASAASAVEQAPGATTLWFHAIRELVGPLSEQGKMDEVAHWARTAQSATPLTAEAAAAQVACLSWSGGALAYNGQHELAGSVLEHARAKLALLHAQDPFVTLRFHYAMGIYLACSGDVMNAIEELQLALAAAEEAGDVRTACGIQGELGCSWIELGDAALAEGLLRQALAEARRRSLAVVEAFTLPDLGNVLMCSGHLDDARTTLNKAVEVAERQGSASASGFANFFLSTLAYVSSDFIESERRARLAAEISRVSPSTRAASLSALARAVLAQGRKAEAFEASNEATSILERVGSIKYGESLVRLMSAETRMAMGDRRGALTALRSAVQRLMDRAERITDPRVRVNFLLGVTDNARTFELARAWEFATPQDGPAERSGSP
jgi:eukaryotic-like serine/threonine-protein kinase